MNVLTERDRIGRTWVRLAAVGIALAFVAFLLWLMWAPHASGQVRQMILTGGGCCCGQAAAGPWRPAARDGAPAVAQRRVAPAQVGHSAEGRADPGARPRSTDGTPPVYAAAEPLAAAGVFASGPAAAWWPGDGGLVFAPCSASSSATACGPTPGGSVVTPPAVPVAEPPMWPLFLIGAAGALALGWAARRERS